MYINLIEILIIKQTPDVRMIFWKMSRMPIVLHDREK